MLPSLEAYTVKVFCIEIKTPSILLGSVNSRDLTRINEQCSVSLGYISQIRLYREAYYSSAVIQLLKIISWNGNSDRLCN